MRDQAPFSQRFVSFWIFLVCGVCLCCFSFVCLLLFVLLLCVDFLLYAFCFVAFVLGGVGQIPGSEGSFTELDHKF